MALDYSLTTREVIFAYLFGPPRLISRQEAMRFHDALCKALRVDDLLFKYQPVELPKPQGRGFACLFERKEGMGGFSVTLEYSGIPAQPLRLLMSYTHPASMPHASEWFDEAAAAFFGGTVDPPTWQRVVAEVRLRAQCSTKSRDGLAFLRHHVLKLPEPWVRSLGQPLFFASAKIELAPSNAGDDPLALPRRELLIEVLREDPTSIYMELMSNWSAFPDPAGPVHALNIAQLRSILDKPSAYVDEASNYLARSVSELQKVTHE